MDLQYLLLLIGLIIIVVVALSAYDKARVSRRFRQEEQAEIPDATLAEDLSPRLEPTIDLDINPTPPLESDKRFLPVLEEAVVIGKGVGHDAPLVDTAVRREKKVARTIDQELESVEEAASMSLNLNPGIDPPVPAPVSTTSGRFLPDDKIDFIMHLPDSRPVRRNKALGVFKQNEYVLEKPRGLYGQRFGTNYWSNLQYDPEYTEYGDLALAIQLLDGNGPIDETELNTFMQLGLKLADVLQRPTKLPLTFEQALEHAQMLHVFYDSYDVIAGINVVSNDSSGFPGRDIEQAARQLGMQFGALNIFHMKADRSPGCRHLFSMANLYQPGNFETEKWEQFRTQGLTLFMSVPCAHQPLSVFDRLVATANALCELLDGTLQDQERRLLTEKGLAVIRAQIEDIVDAMRNQGIVPGSETALRLFKESAVV
jgi:cell division protein ZipA